MSQNSNNSLSLDYEPIQPTQSLENIMETETQEDLPESQETVTNLDIFIYGDLEDTEEQYHASPDTDERCMDCGNIATANPYVERQRWAMCASCVHYQGYE